MDDLVFTFAAWPGRRVGRLLLFAAKQPTTLHVCEHCVRGPQLFTRHVLLMWYDIGFLLPDSLTVSNPQNLRRDISVLDLGI